MMSRSWSIIVRLLCIFIVLPSCISTDSFTVNRAIRDGDVLVSSQKMFALGFFTPKNSRKHYVGVWYYQIPNKTVVWVANRDDPVNDTSGILAVQGNGGLVIYGNGGDIPLWSANVSLTSPNSSIAKLLDTGNLVLLENGNGESMVWQGFDYPTDTMLSSMKLGLDRRSGLNRSLTSWKSQTDPGKGNCSYWLDPGGLQMVLYKDGAPWWRSEIVSWISQRHGTVQTFVNNEDEVTIVNIAMTNQSTFSRTVVDESGILERLMWDDRLHQWTNPWSAPVERCDFYGKCGPNGNCDPYTVDHSTHITVGCTCLPGYEPKSPKDWDLRDGSGGCVKKPGLSMCRSREGFVKVKNVNLPDSSRVSIDMSLSLKACQEKCLRNCSCTAYYIYNKGSKVVGCVTWYGDLMDTRTYSNVGKDLYVRVDAITLATYSKTKMFHARKGKFILVLPTIAMIFIIFYALWRSRRKAKRSLRQMKKDESEIPLTWYDGKKNQDLAFFDLFSIVVATDNFSIGNKLGEGGFGSVYKGILANGQEVAVKRLSMNSGQGLEELKNEVMLIANLQHRNLVRLYGCCISSEEKILIYEYLPNKSLDFYIFDKSRSSLINWKDRFNIINGIARGILYLHQDSRLKVVHRDIKASNVLLDSAMNPKISDFGLAKMFGDNQIHADTKRVIGTYGYMSPEYAMQGRYSTKSDVFSFGVLLLEIISGKRNTDYDLESFAPNLVGAIWDMWKAGRALEIVDPSLNQSYHIDEVSRCIQISLLCMEECAADRPTMSEVVFMLGNETSLPSPKKPAFVLQSSNPNSSSTQRGPYSVNDVTITILQAR